MVCTKDRYYLSLFLHLIFLSDVAKKGKEKSKAFNASKDLKEDDQNDNVFKCLLRSLDLLFKHNTILSTSGVCWLTLHVSFSV